MNRKLVWIPIALAVVLGFLFFAVRERRPEGHDDRVNQSSRHEGRQNSEKTDDPSHKSRKSDGAVEKRPLKTQDRTNEQEPQKSPERLRIEEAVFGIKIDLASLAPYARESLSEVELMLQTERDEAKLIRLLNAYSYLSSLRGVVQTSREVIRLAKEGPMPVRIKAIEVAGRIGDEAAVDLLTQVMQGPVEFEEEQALVLSAIRGAGLTHSNVLIGPLEKFLGGPEFFQMQALESIGDIGDVSAIPKLEQLAAKDGDPDVQREAKFALEKTRLIAASDRDEKLLELIRSPLVSGEFRWYEWALEKTIRLNLSHLAGALRSIYDEKKETYDSAAPDSFRVRLLDAIRRLGGRISPDELELLRRSGRSP